MNKRGSIVLVLLCINMWCVLLMILLLQKVGLAHYVLIKQADAYLDECRFSLLLEVAKRYVEQYKKEEIAEGVIFNNQVMIEDRDTFRAKIKLFLNENKYNITIIIYSNGRKKIMKKTL